jgi:hypothetical protein
MHPMPDDMPNSAVSYHDAVMRDDQRITRRRVDIETFDNLVV